MWACGDVREGGNFVRCLEAEGSYYAVVFGKRGAPWYRLLWPRRRKGGNARGHRHLPRPPMAASQRSPVTTGRGTRRDYNLTSMFSLCSSGYTVSSL